MAEFFSGPFGCQTVVTPKRAASFLSLRSKPLQTLERGRFVLRLMLALGTWPASPLNSAHKAVSLRSKSLETLERGWCAARLTQAARRFSSYILSGTFSKEHR
jgi:hypothetical protein